MLHAAKALLHAAVAQIMPEPLALLDEGWAPRTTLVEKDQQAATAAAEVLLSHVAGRSATTSDAAYVFSLFGPCKPAAQLGLLTAVALLFRLNPVFPVVTMLGSTCWESLPLRQHLAGLGAIPILVHEILHVSCSGRRFGPDSIVLPASINTSYFDATYTILAAWNLTRYRAVLVLDSDLAVRRSLDHVLYTMLSRPEIAEARTPEGCLDAIATHPWRGNYFNTGVWGVRPSAPVFQAIVQFLQHSGGELQCGIGIQTAAKGFFGRRRIDPVRFDPGPKADQDRFSVGATPWQTYASGQGVPTPVQRKVFMDPRMRPWEILQLHAGYNLKANIGPRACLRRHRHPVPEAAAFVVHWSGSKKPYTYGFRSDRGTGTNHSRLQVDPIEKAAHTEYMGVRCSLWAQFFMQSGIPGRSRQCASVASS